MMCACCAICNLCIYVLDRPVHMLNMNKLMCIYVAIYALQYITMQNMMIYASYILSNHQGGIEQYNSYKATFVC